ncbi:MFS transporter [Phycisphaera mikurensis]|uniref:Major facilitator superfamily protein n=1 Tax=Phycisphaera mikurensis (strain NBRC 102666 / KCTC 22515 / FYK2301M01) TaxID=1142394 RepID=I0IFB8_PHYMF|nr:MFS transporter [Phycisphaera mikurensis]MBB6440651.1 GPH family glycoside/pentoside/hexuronide:cation symporter [Phycisphaera mikurensis]BAM03956.1 major facilitator superfamily protein [Phycisphaera mikurensis NBRC 102666]
MPIPTETASPAPDPSEPRSGPAPAPLPLRVRVGWGLGGIADNFMSSTLFVLGMILYVTAFHVPAGLAGVALSVPRFVDAITDPLIGNLSDNFRSRWGRRRPMIVAGAVGSAVLLPLMWFPPLLETAGNPWYSNGPFWYLSIVGSLYFVFYTLFMVPYTALGFELTDDYDQRTRVLAWRMYLGLAASMTVPALYWFCRLPVFGDGIDGEVNGVRWVTLILAAIVLVTGLAPAIACRERPEAATQPTTPILPAVRATLQNGPFLVLFIAYMAVIMGIFTAGTVGTFALIYYVFQGAATVDAAKDHAAFLGLLAGVLAALTSYGSMFLAAWVSRRTGKRPAMILGLSLMLVGTVSIWFLYDPAAAINDRDGGLVRGFVAAAGALGAEPDPAAIKPGVLLATFLLSLGGQGCWLMVDSMTADICDEDELRTGRRREGMFGAAQGFGRKIALAFTVLGGGFLLDWIGFDPEAAEAAGGVGPEVADRMLLTLILCQGGGLVIALCVFALYPITRARAAATQAELARRRGENHPPPPRDPDKA